MITIEERKFHEFTVLQLNGKLLGGPEAQVLLERLQQMIDVGHKKVLLDLAGVERMNSSGLGILISAFTTFKNNGGDLYFLRPNPTVRKLIEITKLNQVFQIYETEDDISQN